MTVTTDVFELVDRWATTWPTKGIEMETTTLTADLFVSVDGWARGEHSPGYFGYFGPELERRIFDELSRPQHVLMGRRTCEALAALSNDVRDEGDHRVTRLTTTVFSRTLDGVEWPNATIESRDAVESVRALKDATDVPYAPWAASRWCSSCSTRGWSTGFGSWSFRCWSGRVAANRWLSSQRRPRTVRLPWPGVARPLTQSGATPRASRANRGQLAGQFREVHPRLPPRCQERRR
jgi:hypothetical protein